MKICSRCKRKRPSSEFAQKRDGSIYNTCLDCRVSRKVGGRKHGDLMTFLVELEDARRMMTNEQFEEGLVAGIGIAIFRLKNRMGILNEQPSSVPSQTPARPQGSSSPRLRLLPPAESTP